MFQFQTSIIKRRKVNKKAISYGLIFGLLFAYFAYTFFQVGSIPVIDDLVRQIGFLEYLNWFYIGIFGLLAFLTLPGIRTLFQKKVMLNGYVAIDEDKLEIQKGKEKFIIPGDDLKALNFQLKALPDGETKKKDQLFGGSWMKIPTQRGSFDCELQLDTPEKKQDLLNMIEFLKIEHDVTIKVEEERRR